MALNAYAALTLNGTPLSGDVTMTSIGNVDVSADHIEAYEVLWGAVLETSDEGPGRRAATRRHLLPLQLVKRVDQTTPELYRALAQNATVAGDVKIFDTNPEDGTTRHRFTLELAGSRVVSIESESPDTLDADTTNRPPSERVEIACRTITYRDEVNGVEFTDEVSG